MMEKIELTKKDLILLGLMSVLAAVFTVVWMALTGNAPQAYNDIVIEWTAMVRSNKSAEILLLRLLIVLGVAVVVCYAKFFGRNAEKIGGGKEIRSVSCLVAWICSIVVLKFLVFQQTSTVFLLALCIAGAYAVFERKLVAHSLVLYFLSYYAFYALYHAANFLGSYRIVKAFSTMGNASSALAFIFAVFASLFPMLFKNRPSIFQRMILIVQVLLPALFLILSVKEYDYRGEIVNIGIPFRAKCFVAFMVFASGGLALRMLKKFWNEGAASPSDLISIGTCIAVMCFNFYGGQGAVVSTDLHHPFENIFAFQQIFELHQIPFRDFIPPSGLYSVVHGAFFKMFGKGDIAFLSLSDNIFFFTVLSLMAFLLQFHVKKILCLALALFLQFPGYNRVAFMSIVVLLLLLPPLVKRPNLWLKVFLLVSVFHGLYYPVYGVACFVGFIPMSVVQARKVIFGEEKIYRRASFWGGWGIVALVLLSSVPLLWGTLVHILAMSGQSVLADGISIFGQELPGWFMPYSRNIFRYPIYNAMHIVPLALVVWLPVLLFCKLCRAHGIKSLFEKRIEPFTAAASLVLIPVVSYSFSFIRVDMFTFFSRSWSALIVEFILFLVFFAKYVRPSSFALLSLMLLNVLIVPSWGVGVEGVEWKMRSKINVPNDYTLVRKGEVGFSTVGKCFLRNDFLGSLNYERTKLSETGENPSFAKLGSFGQWYIFKQKGGANIEGVVMKSYAAAKETKETLLRTKSVVGTYIDPNSLYYLFNWLVSSGDYVWSAEKNSFVPNENRSLDEARTLNKTAPLFHENYDLGTSADVFGLSFKTLRKIFSEKKNPYTKRIDGMNLTLDFSEAVHGKDMDFLYLEFTGLENDYLTTEFNMTGEHEKRQSGLISRLFLKKKANAAKRIFVYFYDENDVRHCVHANYGNGKLLVNLGVGMKWLLESHSKIEISLQENGNPAKLPELKEIKFLKCRQIYEDKFDYNE